ncbi:hypothetical protein [Streptomyces sp. NPDC050528]|uniref:hypothetical protein n=1 Tax=unclassified Streptomyces TaxID=2593676 RepID=UPI0037BDF864
MPTPADRGPGQPWRPGTPAPAPVDPDTPGADIRIGYARCSTLTPELQTERENIREATLEVLDTAARKGNHGGRPPAITDDMLHTVLRRRANGEMVGAIQPDLLIPTGRRKGQCPSLSSIYQALAEHEKTQAYPEAVETAHADFAALKQCDHSPK